jgi:hypothetical protein
LIEASLSFEFQNNWKKKWSQEGKELQQKISKLEKQIHNKQRTFHSLHEKMKPFFFFTDNFDYYKNKYFDGPIATQNQQWEMNFIKEMSGTEKEKGQNIQEYREATMLTIQSNNRWKLITYTAPIFISFLLSFLLFFFLF